MEVIGRGGVTGVCDVTGVVRGESELEDGRRLVDVSVDGVVDSSEPEKNNKLSPEYIKGSFINDITPVLKSYEPLSHNFSWV